MNNLDIRKLAKLTIQSGKVDSQIAGFVLENLSRKELVIYLRFFQRFALENMVEIFSSSTLPDQVKNELTDKFSTKTVVFEQDSDIVNGFRIKMGDTIVNLTLNSYLENTINKLKE